MDIIYPLLRLNFSPKYYLTNSTNGWLADVLENSFYGTVPYHKRPQIVMHFIQKLQGGNNNETY